MLDNLRQDLKYALRGLRATPGFASAVIFALALGLGANAAMFGIVDRMLFRPPPYMIDPSTAHRVYSRIMFRGVERGGGNQYARFRDFSRWTTSFSRTAGFTDSRMAFGVGDAARERA